MSRKITRLKKLIEQYCGQSKASILQAMGTPLKKSDDSIWFYRKISISPFNYEIIFIFEQDEVVDIAVDEYFLWIEISSVFYEEGGTPEYKVRNYI